ncbi:MAG: lipoyl(octanoyl) transferase LipB [Proteobacteria bacterium]|nr:lipoyl(octanoyl) transferase LipB [Pseudomonadota bacterium]
MPREMTEVRGLALPTEPAATRRETVDWRISEGPQDYADAVAFMERRVQAIRDGRAPETVWLLEHPPLYTAGTSARPEELLDPDRFPVFRTGRGGRYTYHGPGQRVAYVMLDLTTRGNDVRAFVRGLEAWLIATLARFGVRGERRPGRVGIWVDRGGAGGPPGGVPPGIKYAGDAPATPGGPPGGVPPGIKYAGGAPGREGKIAAIGVRVRHWVTFHGVSINVDPDLGHFAGIVPCGVTGHGVTSLRDLGVAATMAEVDAALMAAFAEAFGAAPGQPRRETRWTGA